MKITSWNVNGLRAIVTKGFAEALDALDADVVCLQETKAQDEQVAAALADLQGYAVFSSSAVKKGYSGVAILSRVEPLAVQAGIGIEAHDQEGRVLVAEFEHFYLLSVYTPNSGSELARLAYRQSWDVAFLAYVKELEQKKPVLMCGDFNVAHRDIDLARPKPNYNKSAGYMQEEIDGLDRILDAGFVDTFRHLHRDEVKYSWWSYRAGARGKNIGWRIDYVLGTESLVRDHLVSAEIHDGIMGSDHCPVSVGLDLPPVSDHTRN